MIYIIDIDGVDSANQRFSGSVFLEARWNIPALRHSGPAPLVRRTTDVWTPRLVIVNQQQAWSAFPPFVEIQPDGEVVYRQKTWGWFSQPLDLRDFPLDRQTLSIHLVAAGLSETEVKMVDLKKAGGRQSTIAKKLSMPDFQVTSWKAQQRPYVIIPGEKGIAGFIMEIETKRLASYYIWKVIFPLCLIVMLSWSPLWIDPTEISTSIAISTTAFLTLIAYLFAVAVLLPRVPYLTRLDRFILLSTLLVFAGLIQTILSAYLINLNKLTLVKDLIFKSRIVYPIALLAVLATSFI